LKRGSGCGGSFASRLLSRARRFAARCATALSGRPLTARFASLMGWGRVARARDRSRSVLGGGGPELGGAASGEDALAGDLAGVGELGERLVELGGGGVAVQQVAQLGSGQPVGQRVGERSVDLSGERIAGAALQCPG